MAIVANIILDSISEGGVRLTTFELIYPRFIHGEFMTHRVFSRNASSSRAIPIKKMIAMIRNEPAMPIHWGMNQAGMQAYSEVADDVKERAKDLWMEAANSACDLAERMNDMGLHKQIVNRITEPFQHIHVVMTATDMDNFFELRDHEAAQPEIEELAIQMRLALEGSTPTVLKDGEWHIPFIREDEKVLDVDTLLKISTARCARVSYMNHNGQKPTIEEDTGLYDRLVGSRPLHASPTEHQASATNKDHRSGNFRGWVQHRKLLEQKNTI